MQKFTCSGDDLFDIGERYFLIKILRCRAGFGELRLKLSQSMHVGNRRWFDYLATADRNEQHAEKDVMDSDFHGVEFL